MNLFLIIYCSLFLISCNHSANHDSPRIIKVQTLDQQQSEISDSVKVYTVVDEMPRFPGCETEEQKESCSNKLMLQYLYKHLKITKTNKDQFLESKIVVSYIVKPNGMLSNISILKGERTAKHSNILEVLQGMPKWIPGKLKGEVVHVKFHLPIGLHFE